MIPRSDADKLDKCHKILAATQNLLTVRFMSKIFPLSPEMQQSWDDIMGQMIAFVNDTNADVDMAYDWVCEMLDIDSFVDNEKGIS